MAKYNNYSDKKTFVEDVINNLCGVYNYNAEYYNKENKVCPANLPYEENIVITDREGIIIKIINVSWDSITSIICDFYNQFFKTVMKWNYYDGGDNE